jgi:hypothetical protein
MRLLSQPSGQGDPTAQGDQDLAGAVCRAEARQVPTGPTVGVGCVFFDGAQRAMVFPNQQAICKRSFAAVVEPRTLDGPMVS